jgi:hypothetical protein
MMERSSPDQSDCVMAVRRAPVFAALRWMIGEAKASADDTLGRDPNARNQSRSKARLPPSHPAARMR